MTNKILTMGLIPFMLSACTLDNNPKQLQEIEDRSERKGRISIPLTATSTSGATYQLNLPEVNLSGPEEIQLNPQGEFDIDMSLMEGEWDIEISEGWGLEKMIDGEYVPVSAELTSENPQEFSIYAGETTFVVISFKVLVGDVQEEIEFQYGDLEIEIEVDDTSESETVECSISGPTHYEAEIGEVLNIEWQMDGDISEEVYVSVFNEEGEYHLAGFTENDGKTGWTLPADMDPDQQYYVYVEDSENRKRLGNCSSSAPLNIITPEPETCSLSFEEEYQAYPAETINIEWEMDGFYTEQVWLTVHSEGGQNYYLHTFTENTGSYEWTLPEDLDPQLTYHIYVEDAENDQRGRTCWRYSELDVLGYKE